MIKTTKKTKTLAKKQLGGPAAGYAGKGALYNEADKKARSKYYTPDNIRKSGSKVSDKDAAKDIKKTTNKLYKQYTSASTSKPKKQTPKKQDGGAPGWQAKSKPVKNSEWQTAPRRSGPFSVVPPTTEVPKEKPKPNWVQAPVKKKGGEAKDKNWIQKAVNPEHKGYCTPMTKPTCTPKRKALARTFKKMAKNR
jgi:hypothetical protein